MRNKRKGKILVVVLAGALLGTQMPGMSVAEGAAEYIGGICEHHPEHTEECGYQEAVPEQPCRHEHTKECYEYDTSCVHVHTEECYPLIAVEVPAGAQDTGTAEDAGTAEEAGTAAETQTEWVRGPEPTACTHVCSQESGCVTKTLNCIHEDTINADGSITYAVHDESCGYAPAVEGKECTFVCEICSAPEETDSETETSTEKNTEAGTEGTDEDETDSETETSTEETPDSDAEMETDEVVTKVQAMIDALPSVSEVEQMTKDEQKEVYDKAQDAADAYFDELTEEQQQQGQVDTARLEELLNFFNGQVSTMAYGTGWELSSDGVLTITSRIVTESEYLEFREEITEVIISNGVSGALNISFKKCTSLKKATIGNAVTSIGSGVFEDCTSLTEIVIPDRVTSIGSFAFHRCTSLTEIVIPDSVTSIGEGAFEGCTSLTEIVIPDRVTSIGNHAFYGCHLWEVTIGNSVRSIGGYAFAGAIGAVKEVTIPDSVESIGDYAFFDCGVKKVTIPDSVRSIGDSAFERCGILSEVTIGKSVTNIGSRAFSGCNNLTKVALPETAPTTVSNDSFDGVWNQIDFSIREGSIGKGEGKYDLSVSPWNQIKKLNGKTIDGGKYPISSVTVELDVPQAEQPLAGTVTCNTEGVSSYNIIWTTGGEAVTAGTTAEFGTTYTAEVTLSANTAATPIGYKFTDQTAVTLKGESVTGTAAADGSTLTFTKTYQIPKQSQNSPVISIDYQNETLSTTAGMEYSTDKGEDWNDCSADMEVAVLGWDGTEKSVQIRMKETEDKYASASTTVTIPARPASPNIQADGSTASSINVQADGVSKEAAVQYQLVANGDSIDSEKWQQSGKFTNLKAGTVYTAYAKCEATSSSFASISSGLVVRTAAAAYTISIPSATLTAGDSTSKTEISVTVSAQTPFDLGYNGKVLVKVKSGEAVSAGGSLTLTRQGASDTLTSAMLVNGNAFTNITEPVATFTMNNYNSAKAAVSFAQPKPAGAQTVIPAGTYSGTVNFVVSYSE